MLNGSSPLHSSTSPGSSTRSRDIRERESLNSSIRSSFAPRVPAEFDTQEEERLSAPTANSVANETGAAHGTLTLR